MANRHGGLGKGLGAFGLTPAKAGTGRNGVQEIKEAEIRANRYQPRTDFDEAALEELCTSVKQYGVLQPLLVRRLPEGGYEVIAGERRLRAARLAGLATVPAIVREYSDTQVSEVALIENVQRENLNAMEEARAYDHLMNDFGMTQEEMAKKIGRSRSHIANFLRLLKLTAQVQAYVANGSLTMGQARPLITIEDPKLQRDAAEYIQSEELSARQAEALVKKLAQNPKHLEREEKTAAPEEKMDVFVRDAVERLTEAFGTQVRIQSGKKKSRIEIEFYGPEDLERIMGMMLARRNQTNQEKIEALRKVSLAQNFTV